MIKEILPNVICIGAQKSGTTTLHDILKQHPDIYLPVSKEAHFFDISEKYQNGLSWWVDNYFKSYSDEKIIGVITPEYLYFEEVPKRIFNDLGDVKIIITLRNPVERAYSHYKMSVKRGYETENFGKSIELENGRIGIDYFHKSHFSYITRGLYSEQIERYLKFFPKENIMFLIFEEDIVTNIDATIDNIVAFLNIDEKVKINTNITSNQATSPRSVLLRDIIYKNNNIKKIIGKYLFTNKMKISLMSFLDSINQAKEKKVERLSLDYKRELLEKYYINDIKELEKIIERDLSIWRY